MKTKLSVRRSSTFVGFIRRFVSQRRRFDGWRLSRMHVRSVAAPAVRFRRCIRSLFEGNTRTHKSPFVLRAKSAQPEVFVALSFSLSRYHFICLDARSDSYCASCTAVCRRRRCGVLSTLVNAGTAGFALGRIGFVGVANVAVVVFVAAAANICIFSVFTLFWHHKRAPDCHMALTHEMQSVFFRMQCVIWKADERIGVG